MGERSRRYLAGLFLIGVSIGVVASRIPSIWHCQRLYEPDVKLPKVVDLTRCDPLLGGGLLPPPGLR